MKGIISIIFLTLSLHVNAQVALNGKITCHYGQALQDVVVSVVDLTSGETQSVLTNQFGEYSFCNLDSTHQYRVQVVKVMHHAEEQSAHGLDIVDLELLRQHIQQEKSFTQDESWIAQLFFGGNWRWNQNPPTGYVRKDLLEIFRKYLLNGFYYSEIGFIKRYPGWSFYREELALNDPKQNNTVSLQKLNREGMTLNWIAVKAGDFDGSACE
ncbi:MAG: carboxypeptidase-like regulatory domain-containing protein [Haliscomenobacter sp.]|uniref:carboxypeptidase-like regulatory domain-containing protein n=1 Tax=Haliscomenobacter sp. TaxID=2717303 RepID=UPI0029B93B4B|nr:carboxypeptidase-like regulatory domain-containing protein [Haliscomenobacter sp.]MDX2070726.1 carboxypeptidase-like regulatory domain-containing protein [Haliscomenobacter sp.]